MAFTWKDEKGRTVQGEARPRPLASLVNQMTIELLAEDPLGAPGDEVESRELADVVDALQRDGATVTFEEDDRGWIARTSERARHGATRLEAAKRLRRDLRASRG